jgi:hypothetical protein
MKKILLSIAVFAGITASAQSSYTATSVTYEFNGNDTLNCGVLESGVRDAQVPSSKISNTASYNAAYTGTALEVTKTSTADGEGWHKLFLLIPKASEDFPCAEDTTIDLTNAVDQKFNICLNATDSVKQFVIILMDENENWADAAPWEGVLYPGDTCLTFDSALDFGASVDPTKIAGFGIYFRNAWNDNASSGVFTIDNITLGRNDVGTNEVNVTGLNVYPNPATDALNVVFDATSASSVQLTDLTGKVVAVQTANAGANTISFNVENVNAGVYFVNISNASGNVAQKVIIK